MVRSNGYASIVIVLTPDAEGLLGAPIVRDPAHSNPLWKFPGGKGEGDETGAQTASRELEEETGIAVSTSVFKTKNIIGSEEKKERAIHAQDGTFVKTESHFFYPYYVLLAEMPKLKDVGDEGEKVAFAHVQDILNANTKKMFLGNHYDLLIKFLKTRELEIKNFSSEFGIDLSKPHTSTTCAYIAQMQS